ncbi:MAG: aspartate--tRNA ligase [Armatimonadetes bacterium]|nr:aspartate--tRNA ligase [Armatimonadota bacterium]
MMRTHWCGELRPQHIGQKVRLCGWASKIRDHGGVIFIDLRDRSGIVQTVFDPSACLREVHKLASEVGSEYVLLVEGEVVRRPPGTENPKLPTGEIEVRGERIEVLNESKPLPFPLTSDDADEMVRLKHRYLDLRRQRMQRILELRYKFTKAIRDFMDAEGFWEIETPILWKHTPEGAREFIVPSRLHPGKFYVLPQSPQLCKQLLMVAGVERYFQIARCFRDEDPRADRQLEFTQVDIEMSFITREDIFDLVERMLAYAFEHAVGIKVETPFARMSYSDAMERYGTDKPDLRFGMEIADITDIVANSSFQIFSQVASVGGKVKALNAVGCASFSRKDVSELTDIAKRAGAKGLATISVGESEIHSHVAKFLSDGELEAIFERLKATAGDLILIVADKGWLACTALGLLRNHIAAKLNLKRYGDWKFVWVVDFPLLQWDEEEGRYTPVHHPFTSPLPEDECLLIEGANSALPKGHPEHPLSKVRANAYDIVLNGYEIGGGSIRIHKRQLQEALFKAIDLPMEEAHQKFGFLLEAFEYGAPPHGGIALGLDRIIAIIADTENIREVIAFPKTSTGYDPMTGSPTPVSEQLLRDTHIRLSLED